MTEQWRAIVGYEGIYEVSDYGRVRSLDRIIITKQGVRKRHRGRILKPGRSAGRYAGINLCGNPAHIHTLVLEAFIGPRPQGLDGCHNNGDAWDNRLTNLRYDTRTGNLLDRRQHGTARNGHSEKTHCPQNHPYDMANTYRRPDGGRGCKVCVREAVRRRRARLRAA